MAERYFFNPIRSYPILSYRVSVLSYHACVMYHSALILPYCALTLSGLSFSPKFFLPLILSFNRSVPFYMQQLYFKVSMKSLNAPYTIIYQIRNVQFQLSITLISNKLFRAKLNKILH